MAVFGGRSQTMIKNAKSGSSVQLHEYSITDSASKTTQRDRGSRTELSADVFSADGGGLPDSGKPEAVEKTAASAPATARGKNGLDFSFLHLSSRHESREINFRLEYCKLARTGKRAREWVTSGEKNDGIAATNRCGNER